MSGRTMFLMISRSGPPYTMLPSPSPVSNNLKGVTKIYKAMRDYRMNFRTGEVPVDTCIVYVKSYEDEWRDAVFNVLCGTLIPV